MPKRPTLRAREAAKKLLVLLGSKSKASSEPLPTVRNLGEQLGLSYATVSRLLQRFVEDGRAWQHPNGRFYPAHAGPQAAVGLPIVVLGRQIQHWSRLYQEIVEGVSEICTTRGYPLVFLSSDKLVCHRSPELPPTFASMETQREELHRLASAMPRLCAGILLDHLWEEELILETLSVSAPRLLLARPSRQRNLFSNTPDFAAGADLILHYLAARECQRIYLGVPFPGDQAVDAAGEALLQAALGGLYPVRKIEPLDCSTPAKRNAAIARLARLTTRAAIVCTEDNVSSLLWRGLTDAEHTDSWKIELVAMQGTGAVDLPITRLRYDYRQIGREAVTAVIERRRSDLRLAPTLVTARET